MPTKRTPRKGSLQFWPRKRINKFLPSVNWSTISTQDKGLLGFICYKVGMVSIIVKDATADSRTKGKKIIIPATVLECPPIKILSVRFYKNGIVTGEILNLNLDKELKRKLKLPKDYKKKIEDIKDFDDIRVIVYSEAKKTGIKKTPDIVEVALSGSKEEKLAFVKENLGKEILVNSVLKEKELVDVRGLTKGKGFQGPVKRFGIQLRFHKSEKGVRKVGSIAPWTPSYVTFRTPMAGQMGMFTRVAYNNKIVKIQNLDRAFKHFGKALNPCIILKGSVQGPAKRQLLLTKSFRPTKEQEKLNYELVEII